MDKNLRVFFFAIVYAFIFLLTSAHNSSNIFLSWVFHTKEKTQTVTFDIEKRKEKIETVSVLRFLVSKFSVLFHFRIIWNKQIKNSNILLVYTIRLLLYFSLCLNVIYVCWNVRRRWEIWQYTVCTLHITTLHTHMLEQILLKRL